MLDLNNLALVLLLVLGLLGLSALAPKLRLPSPVLLVAAGRLLGLVPGLPAIEFAPNLIFFIFLPPLLYEASYQMSWPELVANRRPITLLAVGLVLLTTTAVAALVHYYIPGASWALGFVLGAIVAPPHAARY